ncbi:MAG: serine/threonine-protein kinase [Anaeromyxobacter sp.]
MERVRKFYEELRRRRILRAMGAYAVGAFALLQVSEPVVHGLSLPEWVIKAVVIACAAGFPVAFVLAWLFDLTARGIERTPDAPSSPRPPTPPAAGAPVHPGAMTALLDELARAPEVAPQELRPLRPGETVGRFEILREIGRGGFGVVYEARDGGLGRLVALKTIQPRRGVDAAMLGAEAEAAAQLQHPNIVTIHDLGTDGARAWMVLELLRGETLQERLRHGPMTPAEALRTSLGVARGLAHAHRAGIVHRDLKTANVFLTEDGSAKILDFGLSRMFGSAGLEGGTPGYMAPEQARGEPQDARTDVFAAAVMTWEMLTGARPYPVVDGRNTVLDAAHPPRLPVSAPAALRRLLAAALQPESGEASARRGGLAGGADGGGGGRGAAALAPLAGAGRRGGRGGGRGAGGAGLGAAGAGSRCGRRAGGAHPGGGRRRAQRHLRPRAGRPLRHAGHLAGAVARAPGADPLAPGGRHPAAGQGAAGGGGRAAGARDRAQPGREGAAAGHRPPLRRRLRHRAAGAGPDHQRVPLHHQGAGAGQGAGARADRPAGPRRPRPAGRRAGGGGGLAPRRGRPDHAQPGRLRALLQRPPRHRPAPVRRGPPRAGRRPGGGPGLRPGPLCAGGPRRLDPPAGQRRAGGAGGEEGPRAAGGGGAAGRPAAGARTAGAPGLEGHRRR